MDLSMKWLRDYVKVDEPIKKFCYDMTMTGSKVEGYEIEAECVTNCVVGKILKIEKHPDADKLVVCQVNVGERDVQIVTAATNCFEGALVPVALDGSTLAGGIKIKKGKLRGVVSEGMFCSVAELGVTVHDFPYAIEDGILIIEEDCKPGDDIHDALGLTDTAVEFEITSNRADCLSVLGLAREAAATFDLPMEYKAPNFRGIDGNITETLDVTIENTRLCKRYMAGLVKNVKIGPSPRWLRERLRGCGVRPINNLVDITNYVMLEYGQPMHAFDVRYVSGGKIVVRNAVAGETITTLDGVERPLDENMLVIADAEKPVAVAGVMGGEYSGIMDDTVDVIFESACFDGASVRKTAKRLGMRTDASSRFEKGLDSRGCMPALLRAFELCELLGCGEPVKTIIDRDYDEHDLVSVDFDPDWINDFLGTDISREDMVKYLEKIDFKVKGDKVYSPSFRIDIESPADIAEEVARFYGYNNIKGAPLSGVANAKYTPAQKLKSSVQSACVSLGLNEIATFSFISPKCYDKICLPEDSALRNYVLITNPLGEDTSSMRTTALPSMCEVLARNYNARNPEAKLFELATEYISADKDKLPAEPTRLAIGMYGKEYDFYSLKGAVDELLKTIGVVDYDVEAATAESGFGEYYSFHPGRVAVIKLAGEPIAIMGELHPDVLENYGIGTRAYCAKLNVTELISADIPEKTYKPLPKYPATTRDISFVCDDDIPVAVLEKMIKKAVGNILEAVKLFDVYKGSQIEAGRKSVSFSIIMRSHEGTLTDEQADGAIKRVSKALATIGSELR